MSSRPRAPFSWLLLPCVTVITAGYYSELTRSNGITAQWHQWLRYVRHEPPSIEEQQQDILRQQQLKQLARLADERWASKPSYLDKPQTQQPGPATRASDLTTRPGVAQEQPDQASVRNAVGNQKGSGTTTTTVKNPWARETGAPSENWQPESWTPTASQR